MTGKNICVCVCVYMHDKINKVNFFLFCKLCLLFCHNILFFNIFIGA